MRKKHYTVTGVDALVTHGVCDFTKLKLWNRRQGITKIIILSLLTLVCIGGAVASIIYYEPIWAPLMMLYTGIAIGMIVNTVKNTAWGS